MISASKKSTAIFLIASLLVLVSFIFISGNTDLFKGQLSLNNTTSTGLTLEVSNCGPGACTSPSLILTAQDQFQEVELLIKGVASEQVVYAEYLPFVDVENRYEIAFDKSLCGTYGFDSLNSKYTLQQSSECTELTYDFIVSGITSNSSNPIFTEYVSFTLSE